VTSRGPPASVSLASASSFSSARKRNRAPSGRLRCLARLATDGAVQAGCALSAAADDERVRLETQKRPTPRRSRPFAPGRSADRVSIPGGGKRGKPRRFRHHTAGPPQAVGPSATPPGEGGKLSHRRLGCQRAPGFLDPPSRGRAQRAPHSEIQCRPPRFVATSDQIHSHDFSLNESVCCRVERLDFFVSEPAWPA
jgi:hypothetical protein